MERWERQLVLDQLTSSEARLLELVDGLTPEQWSFRETPERWSIAENMEHLVVFENFILEIIEKSLQRPAEPGKMALVAGKDQLVLGLANARETKLNAREAVRPIGRWQDTGELVVEFRKARARTIAFAEQTQADLRDHFFRHIALGDLDCYQWLLVMGQHGARHALQIEEIMADPAYPAASGTSGPAI
jgi:hypothetical protein